MFFKNKVDLYSNRIPMSFLKDFMCTYPKNLPSYFKNIPKASLFKVGRHFNIRTCSGFINFFKRSIVFKSPFDIRIELRNNEIFCEFGSGSYSNENNLGVHSYEQFLKYVDTNKYAMITKLTLGIFIKCKYPVLVTNPWWSMNDFETIPGILNCKNPVELNLFLPIKTNQTGSPVASSGITIKQGTPLCMLHFESEKDLKLIFNKEKINPRDYNGLEYLKTNLKNMVLKPKI